MSVNLDEYYQRQAGRTKQYEHGNVKFVRKAVPNTSKSEQEGRTVYEDKDFCVVQFPGKPEEWIEANERHKKEYAAQWAAFQANMEPPVEGFPLEQWAMMDRDMVEQLRVHGFKTVENLAQCTDEAKRKIGPLAKWCKTAKKFLEGAAAGPNEYARLKEQFESLEVRCKKQEDQIAMLIRRLEAETGVNLNEAA